MSISRGEIYLLRLGPVIGREIDEKQRPVLVLSINDLNIKPLVVTVVPGTKATNKRIDHKNVVVVSPTPTNGLACETIFQCHHIRSLDHSRFTSPAVGTLAPHLLRQIENAVRYTLGFEPGPDNI